MRSNIFSQDFGLFLIDWLLTEIDQLGKDVLDLVLEDNHLSREHLSVWCILRQKVIQTVSGEASIGSQSAKSLLLHN